MATTRTTKVKSSGRATAQAAQKKQPAKQSAAKRPAAAKATPSTAAQATTIAAGKPVLPRRVRTLDQVDLSPGSTPATFFCAEEHSFEQRNAMSSWLAAEEERIDSMFGR